MILLDVGLIAVSASIADKSIHVFRLTACWTNFECAVPVFGTACKTNKIAHPLVHHRFVDAVRAQKCGYSSPSFIAEYSVTPRTFPIKRSAASSASSAYRIQPRVCGALAAESDPTYVRNTHFFRRLPQKREHGQRRLGARPLSRPSHVHLC